MPYRQKDRLLIFDTATCMRITAHVSLLQAQSSASSAHWLCSCGGIVTSSGQRVTESCGHWARACSSTLRSAQ